MENRLPNFKELSNQDGTVYGRHTTVKSVNPYACHFVAVYPNGSVRRGNNLFETGWDDIPQGLSGLSYILSTGQVITLPKFRAYLPLIECSIGMDKSRIFHSINIKCLDQNSIVIWKIVLKQTPDSIYKIGDVILGREPLPNDHE